MSEASDHIKSLKESVDKVLAEQQQADQRAIDNAVIGRKVLHHTKWLELIDKDGYIFVTSPWCNGHGVATLPFRYIEIDGMQEIEYLLMMEKRPCHGENLMAYSLTGGCDKEGEAPIFTAAREVLEESGYVVNVEDMIQLGVMRESKASDMTTHAFAVEIKEGTPFQDPEGDGSAVEAEAYAIWMTETEATWFSDDPIVSHMILRLQHVARASRKN